MSRIERALEKAALIRNKSSQSVVAEKFTSVAAPAFVQPPPGDNRTVDNPLVVASHDPHSPVAEEYRKLKSALVRMTKQDRFDNTLLVTSSLAGEGKSITALNLAVSIAQEVDHSVLLVDADLRKPSLHAYLGLEPERGLSECLREGVAVGDVLVRTGIGKLSLLPSGKAVQNPGRLLASRRMKELVMEMKYRYSDRYVIIDSPPVLPFAETRSIGNLTDGVLFVVKEGGATLRIINDAMEALKGSNILGIVYNDASLWSAANDDRYYSYNYSKTARNPAN